VRRMRTCSTSECLISYTLTRRTALTRIRGVDFVQEKFLGAGDQSNESAIEQAKDEKISVTYFFICVNKSNKNRT